MNHSNNLEGCLSGSLAIVASLLIACFIIVGCAAPRHVTQLVERVQKDTVYLSNIQYDSIYVSKEHSSEYHLNPSNVSNPSNSDTLFIKDVSIEYRYKLLRDTVRIVQRDSIPYEVTVTEIKEITRPLTPFDKLCRICFFFLTGILFVLLVKFVFKLKSSVRL